MFYDLPIHIISENVHLINTAIVDNFLSDEGLYYLTEIQFPTKSKTVKGNHTPFSWFDGHLRDMRG